jgi:hypothetical protein
MIVTTGVITSSYWMACTDDVSNVFFFPLTFSAGVDIIIIISCSNNNNNNNNILLKSGTTKSIVTRLQPRNRSSIPAKIREFYFLQTVETVSGAHPVSYSIGNGGSFLQR